MLFANLFLNSHCYFSYCAYSLRDQHCDSQMSDQSNMLVPENGDNGDVEILWTDTDPVGSIYMLGCASNGREVACSFGPLGKGPYLKVYTGDGEIRWSYNGLGRLSSISAPMIDNRGRVIACDSQKIVMLDNDGTLLWEVPMPGENSTRR